MKILLAEDDSNISVIAKVALERIGKHQVTVVDDGAKAIQAANSETFDLILLDSMMPVKDGLTTCSELKKNPTTASTPVIFLSAKSQDADIQACLKAGAIGYISKPFEPAQICNVIKSILTEKGIAA
jgi:CheY-like chemotaxis protein